MKRTYNKPQIYFDSFELSQAIAACNTDINATNSTCAVTDGETGITYFTDPGVCEFIPPSDNDKVCEHVPASDPTVHTS